MSERFSGGFITKTPVTPTSTSASGIWTLDQQEQAQKAGNWPFGGPFNYIEDVFSTYLYTGDATVGPTISNGIDLSTFGGLVWLKTRSAATGHVLFDSARGMSGSVDKFLQTQNTDAETGSTNYITPSTSGFSLLPAIGGMSANAVNYASWTFRKQPKFFDVVTYTGTGAQWNLAHSLGSTPGFIVCKATSTTSDWVCWSRGDGTGCGDTSGSGNFALNKTTTPDYPTGYGFPCNSSTFNPHLVTGGGLANQNGVTYVAYLFAHNAGGFGLTGTDNVISCGSFTTDASGFADINLGYEAQWALVKKSSSTGAWAITDNMRGWVTGAALNTSDDAVLFPTVSNAETTQGRGYPTATGFSYADSASSTYIYIAIRRGPMKVPTDATKVYGISPLGLPSFSFPPDTILELSATSDPTYGQWVSDRLRGSDKILQTFNTNAEISGSGFANFNQGGLQNTWGNGWGSPNYYVNGLQRSPGFHDVVCYTGTGVNTTITHNLGVVPELMIVRSRSAIRNWCVYTQFVGPTKFLLVDQTSAAITASNMWNDTAPTSTLFNIGTAGGVNTSGATYVAYLFASCPGVSKVGSYTGTGATQTISCGFTGGARFVLIKRTDSTGDWYVWDTTRGMVSGTDPSILLNSSAAQVNANSVYTTTGGFQIVSTAAGINASGGSYIYLAIA